MTCSPFAFDMFIRPQLSPALTQFVQWHHLWYVAAYAATVLSVLPAFAWRRADRPIAVTAHWLAAAYVVVAGIVGAWLVSAPRLAMLANDRRSLVAVLAASVALLWIAAIDHCIAVTERPGCVRAAENGTTERRLLSAAIGSTVFVCCVHAVRAASVVPGAFPARGVLVAALWGGAAVLACFVALHTWLAFVAAIASATRSARTCEYALALLSLAFAIAEFLRRVVCPPLSIDRATAAALASAAGVTVAAVWSGVSLRRRDAADAGGGIDLLLTPMISRGTAAVALVVTAAASLALLRSVERMDWDFVLQKSIVLVEWACVFGVMLRLVPSRDEVRRWSAITSLGPAVVVSAVLFWAPWPAGVTNHAFVNEIAFRVASAAAVNEPDPDPDYFQFLQRHTDIGPGASSTIPIVKRFAAEGFVFRNAFTRYGATRLSVPAIWSGGPMLRHLKLTSFDRINALEKLVASDSYRVAINDFTVRPYLRSTTPVTDLDPTVLSADTDLCQNVGSLERYLDQSAGDRRPVLTYLSPMNVHTVNTIDRGRRSLDGDYPGFYAPYASRLRRLDRCFGEFVDYLKQRGSYDDSIIVVTSDHGDSLGEDGRWGHAVWLYPEHVRVPLMVHVPSRLRAAVTTDLSRVAFTTDITPTLYGLLGHTLREAGPLFGSPLFVARGAALPSRRRASYLLMSSYGGSYGLLRQNGRSLFVSDAIQRRESAFDLASPPAAQSIALTDDRRRVNSLIRRELESLDAFYGFRP
ncbi:MAG: sulfatase-like hydrolase/transferase [Acidobacteria bacterium]|nr:sulfatase-like hydrolase/transferase [Acidobacteriota bacterium]